MRTAEWIPIKICRIIKTFKYSLWVFTSICYDLLRRLRQIRREIMIQLVMSLVISRIDYCNSVLVGLAASTLTPLQRVHNAAARLILRLSRSHITPALKQLYWLAIKFCITFKVATLMYNIFCQHSPSYLKDLVAFSPSAHQHQLRSSTTRSAVVHRTRTQLSRCTFSVSGPYVWNSLPTHIRLIDSQPAFRRALKTHLFNIAFN